jgi:hypothetical protein
MAGRAGCSLRTYCRLAYNRFLTGRLFSQLGLSGEWSVSDQEVQPVLEIGQMATRLSQICKDYYTCLTFICVCLSHSMKIETAFQKRNEK